MIDWASNASRLGAIGAAAALLLAVVNYFTEPVIESLHQAEVHATLKLFVGEGTPGPKEENPAPNVISRVAHQSGQGMDTGDCR